MRPSARKPTLDPALEAGATLADGVFLGSAHAHHHRPIDLPRHVGRDGHLRVGRALRAETAAAVFGDIHEVLGLDADVTGKARDHRRLALARAEHEDLAVLPVSHGGTGLHALMALGADHEAFVEDELCLLEAGIKIAIGPFFGGLAHRQVAFAGRRKVARRPLDGLEFDPRIGDVAVGPGRGAGRMQAVERIDHERQRLVFDLDEVDGILGELLGFRRDREDRVADVERLVGQDRIVGRRECRHVICRDDAEHALQLERGRAVDALHLGVRHRAREHAAEHHAVGAVVLRVFRLAGDLAVDVGRGEILADQIVCHLTPPGRRASPH